MKSKRIGLRCLPAPSADGRASSFERADRAEDRLRGEDRREQRDDRADAEREREALDARGREHEQDERDHDRHDVRVDDRREALLVARGDARRHRSAGADLLLDAFEDDDVRVGRDADRQDQARDARQRQRDRDELDQREEVDRVDDQRERPRSRRARGRRSSRKSATIAKPATPAMRPWSSACWPSVAETCDCEISSSLTGSAPVFRRFARSCADSIVKPPSICEPLRAVDAVRVLRRSR